MRDLPVQSTVKDQFGAPVELSLSPDGTKLATVQADDRGRVFDLQNGTRLFELVGHTDVVTSLDWSPDGSTLVSGSMDGTVRLWNATDGSALGPILDSPESPVLDLVWSPDGERIAAATPTGEVLLIDPVSHVKTDLLGPEGAVNALSWSPDGQSLAASTNSGHSLVWNVGTGEVVFERDIEVFPELNLSSISWSPDGTRLVVSDTFSGVEIWDVVTGQRLASHPNLSFFSSVTSAAWSPDGNTLAFGFPLRFWNRDSQQITTPEFQVEGGNGVYASLDWSSDGKLLAIVTNTTESDGVDVRVMRPATGEIVAEFDRPQPKSGQLMADDGEFMPGTHILAVSYGDNTVWLWDVDTGEVVPSIQVVPGTFGHAMIAWSPDGSLLALADWRGLVGIWDAESGETVHPVLGTSTEAISVGWSPSGDRLAVGAGQVLIYAGFDQAPLELPNSEDAINVLAWSPNGRWLVSGGTGTSRIWDTHQELADRALFESSWLVNAADWSPDGSLLALGGGSDSRLYQWYRTGAVMEIWGCRSVIADDE